MKKYLLRCLLKYIAYIKGRLIASGITKQIEARAKLNPLGTYNNLIEMENDKELRDTLRIATKDALSQIDSLPFYHRFGFRKALKWYVKLGGL